jgi:hypothetical protein
MSTPLAARVATFRQQARALSVWGAAMCGVALASGASAAYQMRFAGGRSLELVDLRAIVLADSFALFTGLAVALAALVGLALYARFTHVGYTLAAELGVRGLSMSASRAAWGFALPVVMLWRPWRALSDLTRGLEGALASPRAPRAAADASGHYRDNAAEASAQGPALPPAPLGQAWALWWTGQTLSLAITIARPQVYSLSTTRDLLTLDVASQLCVAGGALLLGRVAVGLAARVVALANRLAVEA